ncbi:MAG TPA: tetratricopeptide repeat protein [Paludibaculum sp.]|jgi:tetratricopeptide (TPR) repeat protein
MRRRFHPACEFSGAGRTPQPGVISLGLLTLLALGTNCAAQTQSKAPCGDAKAIASKLAGRTDYSAVAAELGRDGRSCAGTGYLLLAQDAFDSGRLAEAGRYIDAALGLGEAEPVNAALLLGALRIQGAIYVERGMLSEALALIERLKALLVESPEQSAAVRGLAGACYQAAGDYGAAEREYIRAIEGWDRMQRSEEAISERVNLGVLYLASRRFDEAVVVLERANALLAVSGKSSPYYLLVLTNNLAVAHSERGDNARAVRHAREAVRLAETAGMGRYQLTANVYFNSVGVLRAAGRKKEASELEDRAIRANALANAIVDVSDLREGSKRRH